MRSLPISLFVFVSIVSLAELLSAQEKSDRFRVTMLHPTAPSGREWFANWKEERVIGQYANDPLDAAFRNGDGELRVENGGARISAGLTRLVVRTPEGATPWRNVEMTMYVRRGAVTKRLDYQAFYLSARSGERHSDEGPCEGTSYHSTLRFDGQCGFKKELWHTGGYTALRPKPAPKFWPTVPEGQWIGMKFVCRNVNQDRHVRLEQYVDPQARNEWQLVSSFTDTGDWKGEKPGCDRPQNAIITEARPAVYFRCDYVDVELKHFSVREIAAE